MGFRVSKSTNEVLSFDGQKYENDDSDVLFVDQADARKLLASVNNDRRKLVFRDGAVQARPKAEIEAIDKRDAAIPKRRETARTRLKSALDMGVVRQVTSLDHARAVIDAEVIDLDDAKGYLAKLLYTVIQTGRALESSDDDFFPEGE